MAGQHEPMGPESFMTTCALPPSTSQGPEPQAVEEVLRRKKTDEPLPDEPSDTEDTDSGSRTKKKKGKTDEEESFVEEDEVSVMTAPSLGVFPPGIL